jgi:hypothetical protein
MFHHFCLLLASVGVSHSFLRDFIYQKQLTIIPFLSATEKINLLQAKSYENFLFNLFGL